jgi:small subunit ribosomal protein S2
MTTPTDIRELAENACHFGHKVNRWNPKMESFLWGKRGGVHVFDLEKTAKGLDRMLETLARSAIKEKTILFVSTKPQTKRESSLKSTKKPATR